MFALVTKHAHMSELTVRVGAAGPIELETETPTFLFFTLGLLCCLAASTSGGVIA